MPCEARRELMDATSVVHGALDFEELGRLGLRPGDVLDFSANTNPFGPSPTVRAALARTPLDCYPDRESFALRAALAESLGVAPKTILAGNGASELIWLIALAYIRPGDAALVVGPTYGEYARAIGIMGGHVIERRAREADAFAPHATAIQDNVGRLSPRIVFVCNPNNPTGAVVRTEAIASWARAFPDILFIVDEAYQPLADGLESVVALDVENVIVLRSLTKDCALAGLRLGYAVGPESLIEPLRRARPPWGVNAFAQAAGVAALRDSAHRALALKQWADAKADLAAALARLGLSPLPSSAPFFMLRVGDGAAFRRRLLARAILVRDCASFGLPTYVRISPRRPEENERLLAVIREAL